ncbi:MAG: DNA ligase [Propionibacteriaceae bacterium]|nr:DNA ligase [Propionibacteriaceae bacterium]
MLATPTATPGMPPSGPGWLHEIKWDGVRALAETRSGRLVLYNRTEGQITAAYPEVVAGAEGLPDGLLIDGELIALDSAGLPSFQAIAHRMHVRNPARAARQAVERPVTFVAFDLLRAGGDDLTRLPLEERRRRLSALDLDRPRWQVSEQHDDGEALAVFTREAGLEGVMSKRAGSVYVPGARSTDWVKTPHRTELVGVIGGWVPETGDENRLGSVWIGHPADEATFEVDPVLYPLGRVGSGLSHAEKDTLLEVLRTTERPTVPFDPAPVGPEARRTRWVEPMLCVQVRYLNVSPSGALRQPVMLRLRPEVSPVEAADASLA